MEEYRKRMIDRFQEHLYQNFKNYCARHGFDPTDDQLITFLIDQDLIPLTQIQRYAVVNEFENVYPDHTLHKTQAVSTVANRFSISERTVWSILKHIRQVRKV